MIDTTPNSAPAPSPNPVRAPLSWLRVWLGALSHVHIAWFTRFHGQKVGEDGTGNVYYRRPAARYGRDRRWVVYAGEPEASNVPPMWHAWLHHQTDIVPDPKAPTQRPWMKPHQPNPTGTAGAYLPPGHTLDARPRAASTADYEPWSPPS